MLCILISLSRTCDFIPDGQKLKICVSIFFYLSPINMIFHMRCLANSFFLLDATLYEVSLQFTSSEKTLYEAFLQIIGYRGI